MNNRSHQQEQFLNVIDRDEAERRFLAAIDIRRLAPELVSLRSALNRVLSGDVKAPVDVPAFDRSNVDGYAVAASSTTGAREDATKRLSLLPDAIHPGVVPKGEVPPGHAWEIATGAAIPRGADAVVMVEYTEADEDALNIARGVAPGDGISFAGSDIARGEIVLREGELLTSRATGLLAALGIAHVDVIGKPRIAVISTGNELLSPGESPRDACVFDSNARILCDAIIECGGEPIEGGIVRDDESPLAAALSRAIDEADAVVLSGGTSKGAGDVCYRVVQSTTSPGIIVHGVALKPGKPVCLASHGGKPVVVLPGFPTSAVFTFHEFVAPIIRKLAGLPVASRATVSARMATRVNSATGRTEYLLVGLVPSSRDENAGDDPGSAKTVDSDADLIAFPMGKGSGSVTTFSKADGFVTIDRHLEFVDALQTVQVQLLSKNVQPADLVVIGSHCAGLDVLLSRVQQRGFQTKFLAVGSTAGLAAAQRGECDIAGIHLLNASTGEYNAPFVTPDVRLIRGYNRRQGIVFRKGERWSEGVSALEVIEAASRSPTLRMVNRNAGSGTRILLDQQLGQLRPPGYVVQVASHNAVAAAVAQQRADWGLAIETVASDYGLGFAPLATEQFDFVVPKTRAHRLAVICFCESLQTPEIVSELESLGFSR